MTDSERLIKLEVKVDTLCKLMSNHLKHHWAITIIMLVFLLGLIAEVTVLLIT